MCQRICARVRTYASVQRSSYRTVDCDMSMSVCVCVSQIHAATEIPQGSQLTRNYIPSVSTAPEPVRQAALREAGYEWQCHCHRCRLEQQASPAVQEALQVREA